MINKAPENWNYTEGLEMLFLLYQVTDELLSETTVDTYALPLHNTVTLMDEIEEIFQLLKAHDMQDEYYKSYIPSIIDEFLLQIIDDYILKQMLDKRLDSIITALKEAKETPNHLQTWINVFNQSCSRRKYLEKYQKEIVRLVMNTKDKDKLIYCLKNYYICLIAAGYSREFIYNTAKRFFNNRNIKIEKLEQVKEFFEKFNCTPTKFEFLILMDMDCIEYMDSISSQVSMINEIQRIDVQKQRSSLCEDIEVKNLFKVYDNLSHNEKTHQKFAVVSIKDTSFDPYKSAIAFNDYLTFLQTFKRYFIHHNYSRQVYYILLKKNDGSYMRINLPNKLRKRPYIDQRLIDKRIKTILHSRALGKAAFSSLVQALEMHADAFDSKNTLTLFRSLWTALETLFVNPNSKSIRDNTLNSTCSIIQKTYLLKSLRCLYMQINDSISSENLKKVGITDFPSFIQYFSSFEENSTELKVLYNYLTDNPLLRIKIYALRKNLKDGVHISNYLEKHRIRVEWQLSRLYRIRNVATHLGIELNSAEYAVNHLHNYFDYVINYMLCKSERGQYITDLSTLVFESKNDLRIQFELLKENKKLSAETYTHYLFGPDTDIMYYNFEH